MTLAHLAYKGDRLEEIERRSMISASQQALTRAKPNGRALGVGAVMAELEKRSG